MDPLLSTNVSQAMVDSFTYTPIVGNHDWYEACKRKYNSIYQYNSTAEGITITEIHKHFNESYPYPPGFKPVKPNGISLYFPDTTPWEEQLPYGSHTHHIIFNFDLGTQVPQIYALLNIARSVSPDAVQELIKADSAQPIWPGTSSQTALSHPLLRELLLVVALRSFIFQGHRLAPGAQDLVKHIALSGPPVAPFGVKIPDDELPRVSEYHRRYIWTDEGSRWAFVPCELRIRRDAEAALVKNGWRDPKIGAERIAPPPPRPPGPRPWAPDYLEYQKNKKNDDKANSGKESASDNLLAEPAPEGISDLVDALLHVGYLDTDDKRADVLTKVARFGSVDDIKFTMSKIERESITLVHECEMLPAAAAGGKGRAEVLKFLLKSGLDPNAVSKNHKDKQRTALHVAIRHGDVDMVSVLLEGGAKMVKDTEWGLPIEAAEESEDREDRAAKVAVIERCLEERGLPRDHIDLPVVIDEDLEGFSGVGWAT
ncbi:hypothetical protein V8F20_006044 [Naviculisporaceae sp. PSN 640]